MAGGGKGGRAAGARGGMATEFGWLVGRTGTVVRWGACGGALLAASHAATEAGVLHSFGASALAEEVMQTFRSEGLWAVVGPGGTLHPQRLIEGGYHIALEVLLVGTILLLLSRKSYRPKQQKLELSPEEIEDLCAEWKPEPLIPADGTGPLLAPPMRIESMLGDHVMVGGHQCVNCASTNFIGIQGDSDISNRCEKAMDKYGVGSCGPRGFYGTFDVHLSLEERMARFMGVDGAVLYAYDAATASSVIPSFCKKGDQIVADASVCYGIQTGIELSRSDVTYFKHNDVKDLHRVLKKLQAAAGPNELKQPSKRRFLVIEGIYGNSGDVAPLREIYNLAKEFKYRIIMDESFSLGVLGRRGRGLSEDVGLEPRDIDIIVASLGNSLGSAGGMCLGSRAICYHLRLNSSGYVFSASLPPFLAVAAEAAIDKLDNEPDRVEKVGSNARTMRRELNSIGGVTVLGNEDRSPLIHLKVHVFKNGAKLLRSVVDSAAKQGVLVDMADYCALERSKPSSTIRITVSSGHSKKDVIKAAERLKVALKMAISKFSLIDDPIKDGTI